MNNKELKVLATYSNGETIPLDYTYSSDKELLDLIISTNSDIAEFDEKNNLLIFKNNPGLTYIKLLEQSGLNFTYPADLKVVFQKNGLPDSSVTSEFKVNTLPSIIDINHIPENVEDPYQIIILEHFSKPIGYDEDNNPITTKDVTNLFKIEVINEMDENNNFINVLDIKNYNDLPNVIYPIALGTATIKITSNVINMQSILNKDFIEIPLTIGKSIIKAVISISGDNTHINVGDEVEFSTTVYYSDGSIEENYNGFEYESSNIEVILVEKEYIKETESEEVIIKNKITGIGNGVANILIHNTTLIDDSIDSPSIVVTVFPEYIILNNSELNLHTHDTTTLIATVYPKDSVYDKIEWSCPRSIVLLETAEESEECNVTAVGDGISYITAEVIVDGKKIDVKQVCNISIENVLATDIILNKTAIQLKANESFKLTAILAPTNVTYDDVIFTSSDESIAEVDETGLVSAIGNGTCNIIVKSKDEAITKEVSVKVSIYNIQDLSFTVKNLSLKHHASPNSWNDYYYYEVNPGISYQIQPHIVPSHVDDDKIYYMVSNSEVAHIDNDGLLTVISTKKNEEFKVAIKSRDGGLGYSEIFKIEREYFDKKSSGDIYIEIDKENYNYDLELIDKSEDLIEYDFMMNLGDTITFIPKFNNKNVTIKSASWSLSSRSSYFTKSSNEDYSCTLTANKIGNTCLRGIFKDYGNTKEYAYININVKSPITSMFFYKLPMEIQVVKQNIKVGESIDLYLHKEPSNTTNSQVTFYASNENINVTNSRDNATTITAISPGKARVIAMSDDNNDVSTVCLIIITEE